MRNTLQRLIAAFVAAILVSALPGCKKETPQTGGGSITSISLTESAITLSKGGSYQLTASYAPLHPDNPTLVWSSSNEDVAQVSNGLVTAVTDGKATITVRPMSAIYAGNLTLSASCEVKVETILIQELSFSSDSYNVALARGTFQLDPQVVPAAANKPGSLEYTVVSGDSFIAVDANGLVTLKAIGTGTIKVSTKDGSGLSKTLTIVVQAEDVWPTDFSFDYQEDMVVGTKQRVRLVYEPTTANRKEIVYVGSGGSDWVKVTKISDEEIELEASQVTDGGIWSDTGIQILVTIKTGENSSTTGSKYRYVWVHEGEPSLSIDENQTAPWGKLSDGMIVGETHDLQVDVQNLHKPYYAEKVALTYEVNNPDVLSIDENGKMTALAKGASRVWVYTPDRKKSAEFFVEVFGKPAKITPGSEALFVRYGGSEYTSYHVEDADGKQSRQAIQVTNINSSLLGMTCTVENYADQSRYAKVTFQSARSSAEKTIRGTATVCPLGYPSVTKTIDVFDAMYDANDIKPFDGIKFSDGKLVFVDGRYRGSGYFNDGTTVAPAPSAYSFGDCKALVIWTGQRSSLNLGESKLGGLSGQSRGSRSKVNGYAIAWKDAYTAAPSASDENAYWQRTYTTVDGYIPYYTEAPIWGGGTWLHTGNTYQYGYEITQAEMYYNSRREGENYDILPVRNLSKYTATPPESPVTSGWYVPTSSEWYMMLRCQGDAVSMSDVSKNISKYLSVMTDGQGLVDSNGNSAYHYWSCQEGNGSSAETKAVYMSGFSATQAGTQPTYSKDKKSAACTRGFLAF